jgi:Uma2 family endonuclease
MSVTSANEEGLSPPPGLAVAEIWRLSVEQYHQMIDHCILEEDDPVELLEGLLVDKHSDGLFPLSIGRYHEMIRHGIVKDDDPVELLEGVLVRKMPKNPPHSLTNQRLRKAIENQLPKGWEVRVQEPVTLEGNEPEPDLTVVRGEDKDYALRHPGPGDVVLLTEISESSLPRDRGPKKLAYARAKIALYWIVNLVEAKVEVYSEPGPTPAGPDYLKREDFDVTQTLELEVGGKMIRIPVRDFLPAGEA